ncbi:hypothetical protein ACJX0J_004455 (mitochondrion) [Zea mays]
MVYRGLTPLLQILRVFEPVTLFKKQNAANAVYANMILMRGALLNEMADTQIWIRRNSHAHIVPEKEKLVHIYNNNNIYIISLYYYYLIEDREVLNIMDSFFLANS